MAERGEIHSEFRARQLPIYKGLKWGKITPTDIDVGIDFGNRLFVFVELKYGNTKVPMGQRLFLERVCAACQPRVPTCCLVATHSSNGDIDVKSALVVEYWHNYRWVEPSTVCTVSEAIDKLREKYEIS
jgi:hypothetical protein